MQYFFLLLLAYFCGSVPFGKLIARVHGVDIQKRGSGNIGFSNVRRVLGWRAGLLTLLADIVKGALPTYLAWRSFGQTPAFWVGLVAIAGHLYPVWLKFRGGKGIATGLGVIAVLQPLVAGIGFAAYLLGCLLLHKSGKGSLLGGVAVGVAGCVLDTAHWWQYIVLLTIAIYTLRHHLLGTVPNYDK